MGPSQKYWQLYSPSTVASFPFSSSELISREGKQESPIVPYVPLTHCDSKWRQDENLVPVWVGSKNYLELLSEYPDVDTFHSMANSGDSKYAVGV